MPDWDNTESRESDEDAAWRDLVARFDAPLTGQQPVPWPAREDMPAEPARDTGGADGTDEVGGARGSGGADGASGADGAHGADGVDGADGAHGIGGAHGTDGADGAYGADGRHRGPDADDLDGEPGRHAADGDHGRHAAGGDRGLGGPNAKQGPDGPGNGYSDEPGGISGAAGRHGRLEADGAPDPEVIQVPRPIRGPAARGVPPTGTSADDEEHFVPPAPPPLPKLDPVAKGAWAALFGGPGYLMVATVAGWTVSGLAAFCAVAAFVAGFAILVLRMHDREPGGPNDGDDGAVV